MNLYKILPHNDYFDVVADFIINKFGYNFTQVKVILPNGAACLRLQKLLIKKLHYTILPNIMPFSSIVAESSEVFTIPSDNMNVISPIEERIIVAQIIYDYPKLQFDICQALHFSSHLIQLFYEFVINEIEIKSIKNLAIFDSAEHWQSIYEFLEYAYHAWHTQIVSTKKLDRAHYQMHNLKTEVKRLIKDDDSILIAGLFGNQIQFWNFLKNISNLPNGYIILPPVADMDIAPDAITAESPLYCLTQLCSLLDKKISDFKILGCNKRNYTVLDQLIVRSNDYKTDAGITHIQYFEYDNIFDEASAIVGICNNLQHNQTLAIIVDSGKTKELYEHFLCKYNIAFNDFIGLTLNKTHAFHLITALSEILCTPFDLKKLIILLQNPLIRSQHTLKLYEILRGENRFITSMTQLSNIITIKTQDAEFVSWFNALQKLLTQTLNTNIFNEILKAVIITVQNICPNIWDSQHGLVVHDFLHEILTINWGCWLTDVSNFTEILVSLSSGAKFDNSKDITANITICTADEGSLFKFDYVILANFSESIWPKAQYTNPWFNRQMQDLLKLHAQQIQSTMSLYNFYLLLHNKKVIITRSKKHDSTNALQTSSYIHKLEFIVPNIAATKSCSDVLSYDTDSSKEILTLEAVSDTFPKRISATDIEMLIRSPYSFYAKKILKLKKQESIATPPTSAMFGSFVHKVFDIYSKNTNNDSTTTIFAIADRILQNSILPDITKKIWMYKFTAIAEEFIAFDSKRRDIAASIYTEISGCLNIMTSKQAIEVTAIADRVEITKDGKVFIVDYKTGALPTLKDVESGLSPQLLVETLIAINGGFDIEVKSVPHILYVKIASSKPYIKTMEITLDKNKLDCHFVGLQSLLDRYNITKNFSSTIDLLTINDYKSLMRNF